MSPIRHHDLYILPVISLRVRKGYPPRDLAGQTVTVDPDGFAFGLAQALWN